MNASIDGPLPAVLVEALSCQPTADEREAERRPPYPLPSAMRPHQARLLAELRARTSASRAALSTTRILVRSETCLRERISSSAIRGRSTSSTPPACCSPAGP